MRRAVPQALSARATTPGPCPDRRRPVVVLLLMVMGLGALAAVAHAATAAPAGAATLAPTTTTVTSSVNPTVVGQTTTIKATVRAASGTGSPTGTVTFREGTRVLGTSAWWFGTYNLSIGDLAAGSHDITATYDGDATFAPSAGTVTQTVVKGTYTVALSSSVNPSTSGQPTQLKAVVQSTTPGVSAIGSVTFRDGTRVLGVAGWWFGSYGITVSDLAGGSHALTATYTSDAALVPATGSLTQTVARAATTTTLRASTNPAVAGDGVALKALVTLTAPGSGAPTAPVVFSEGTRVLATVTPFLGAYDLTLPQLPAGPHAITAAYAGDASSSPSTATLTETILVRPTSLSVRTSLDPMVTAQPATLTATVSTTPSAAGAPSGTVTFREGTTVLGSAAWWFGTYSLRLGELPAGDHTITATFPGSTTFGASSASLVQRVRVTTSVAIAAAPAPSTTAETVAVTATVRPAVASGLTPTGTVTVNEGASLLSTSTLVSGRASASLPGLAAGDHVLTLRYSGDGAHAASSGTTTLVVRIASTLTITAAKNPSVAGEAVAFTATVLPRPAGGPLPTGWITIMGGVTNQGSAALVNGTATVTLPTLEAGDHLVTATYTGDPIFRAASTSIPHVVGAPTPASTEPGPLAVTALPTTYRSLGADPATPAAKHGGDGGNQIRLPSDGNLLWASSDVAGIDANGSAFMVNNVVSISSPSNPLVQRQPLSPSGVPYQLVKPTTNAPCTAPGSSRVLWNAGMVAIPQAGWDKVLIWFQSYCLMQDLTLTPQSIGVAEFDYSPALANDMVHPWSDHVRILDDDLFGGPVGVQQPELGPDGNIYLYRCDTSATRPTAADLLGCKVARVAPLDAADASKYRYWDGAGWSATSPSTAAYMEIADVVAPARLPAGMFKVTYIAQANLWVLGSQAWPGYDGTPLFRVARAPQGPWSVPATIPYVGCDPANGHSCYGSMVSAGLSDATHLSVVYYDMMGQVPTAGMLAGTAALTLPAATPGQLHVVTAGITMPSASSGPGPRPLVATQTSVTTPTPTSTGGQTVKVTATVAAAPAAPDPAGVQVSQLASPTGTVTFREGATVLGTASKFFETYSVNLPVLAAGTHTITASFSGDDVYAASSSTLTLTVVKAQTTLVVTSSANPSTLKAPATLTATLAVVAPGAGTPPGVVTFKEGSTVLGSAAWFYGAYNLVLPDLAAGSHTITASFAGDGVYGASSASITQTVRRITTTVGITTSAGSVKVGADVTFSATVSGGPFTSPTGAVTFTDGATVLGTGTWWFGSYNLTVRGLAAGSHTITATYAGDASFLPGSATLIQLVVP